MKKYIILALFFSILLPVFHTQATTTVNVVTPNGGERWNEGSMRQIRWNVNGAASSSIAVVSWLLFSATSTPTTTTPIASGQIGYFPPSQSAYSWFVPFSLIPSSRYKMEVIVVTGSSTPTFSDRSDSFFTITRLVPIPAATATQQVASVEKIGLMTRLRQFFSRSGN